MAEFINTVDALGDDAVIDSIIDRSITEFNDDTVTYVGNGAFKSCSALERVNLPNVTRVDTESFRGASALSEVSFPRLEIIGSDAFHSAFWGAKVCLPSVVNLGNVFGASGIIAIDLPICKSIGRAFYMAPNLETVILRNTETACTLGDANAFQGNWSGNTSPIGKGTGYIYVPRALLDSYKAATNWSTYASQFRALEDYTVDGTITGELDETKI